MLVLVCLVFDMLVDISEGFSGFVTEMLMILDEVEELVFNDVPVMREPDQ